MLEQATADLDNVTVDGFTGLLTTFCQERGAHAIVKGLRAVSDFDYELQMAQMNASLTDIETVFVPTSPRVGPSWPRAWSRRSRRSAATSPAWCPTSCSARSPEKLAARELPRSDSAAPDAARSRVWSGCDSALARRTATSRLDLFARIPEVTPEQPGPESAARARHSRARPPPGVPA